MRLLRLAACMALCVLSTSPSSPQAPASLALVREQGDEQASSTELVRALGTYDRERTPPLEQRVLLVNRGHEPVEIAKVQGSCGCTDLLLFPGDRRSGLRATSLSTSDGRQALTLAPGEKATLRVLLHVSRMNTGALRKYVWLYLPGQAQPTATVALDINVKSQIGDAVRPVDFGRVKAGEARTVPFSVTLDAALFDGARPSLMLASTNEEVRVRPVGGSQTSFQNGRAVIDQAYEITLSPNAALGEIAGRLVIRQAGRQKVAPHVVATLRGEVEGEVRVSPATVLFGAVRAGQVAKQTASIWLASPDIQNKLVVASSSPWIRARILPREGGHALETELSGMAPAGTIEATITLRTASGQRLVVPVVGLVTR